MVLRIQFTAPIFGYQVLREPRIRSVQIGAILSGRSDPIDCVSVLLFKNAEDFIERLTTTRVLDEPIAAAARRIRDRCPSH